MSSPTLLALDTATETVHLALSRGAQVFTRAVAGGAQASNTLLPAIQALVAQAGLVALSLDAVAVGRGPGAFTGLRTACAVAQGLAMGLGVPVIVLDTLMAVAEAARLQGALGSRLWVMHDARMGEIYAAAYEHVQEGTWQVVQSPRLFDPVALVAVLAGEPEADLAGNALRVHAQALASLPNPGRWPEAAPAGQALARLAQAAWARGDTLDPALALPLYVRDKVAQTTAERMAQRAAMNAAGGA